MLKVNNRNKSNKKYILLNINWNIILEKRYYFRRYNSLKIYKYKDLFETKPNLSKVFVHIDWSINKLEVFFTYNLVQNILTFEIINFKSNDEHVFFLIILNSVSSGTFSNKVFMLYVLQQWISHVFTKNQYCFFKPKNVKTQKL